MNDLAMEGFCFSLNGGVQISLGQSWFERVCQSRDFSWRFSISVYSEITENFHPIFHSSKFRTKHIFHSTAVVYSTFLWNPGSGWCRWASMQLQSTLLFGSLGFSESGSPTPKKHGEKSFTQQKTNTQQFFFMILVRMKQGEKPWAGLACDFVLVVCKLENPWFFLCKKWGMSSQMIKNGRKKKYLQTLLFLVGFGSRKYGHES